MKTVVITCDRCKKNKSTEGDVVSFQLIVNARTELSGDLCSPCAKRVVSDFTDLIMMKPVSVGEFTVVRKDVP